jgi:prepilin-type N-terminal cleavage/methylation domain-containing protein
MVEKSKRTDNGGFTLIELLIVILIIGILAGVLIAVINPSVQQNRARDAGVKATMNKVALATEGFISAYGRPPHGNEFIASLSNSSPFDDTACVSSADTCLFSVEGNPLSTGECDADNYTNGAGTGACYYYYVGDDSDNTFLIYGASFGIVDTTFMYDSDAGAITEE